MFSPWWLLLQGIPMFLSFVAVHILERCRPRLPGDHERHLVRQQLRGSFGILSNVVVGWLVASYLCWVDGYFSGFLSWLTNLVWLRLLLSFVTVDVTMYWWHRICHSSESLWRYHLLHHEEQHLSVFSTFRFHPTEVLCSLGVRCILFPLLGIDPAGFLVYNTCFFMVILFHHSNFKITSLMDTLLQLIIVSPNMHHLHHSNKGAENNSNFGSVLSIWDFVFSTHLWNTGRVIIYGLEPAVGTDPEARDERQDSLA